MSLYRQLKSFTLPFTVLILIPIVIENNLVVIFNYSTIIGSILMIPGIIIMVITICMFISIGKGTLAPWDPSRKLITNGIYGHVRNPMILGVFIILCGEALLFQSVRIGIWALLFIIINTIYYIYSEEPKLERRFGNEYRKYRRNVPRWIPRLSQWRSSK